MPELPEVETIRRGLEKHLRGRTLKKVIVLLKKQFQGEPKEVEGSEVIGVRRKGKVTAIDFSNGKSLLVHLKLTGQLVFRGKGESFVGGHPIPFAGVNLPAKTTHIIFGFDDGSRLFYNDLRQFGWIRMVESARLEDQTEFGKLGPEPLTKQFTVDYLRKIFLRTSKPVKLVLMDQEKIAGIGNIYANDALFEAKVDPRRPANSLTEAERGRLFLSIQKVLEEGIRYGGSSAADEAYVNVEGGSGKYQDHFRVYQRSGKPCLNKCGESVQRISLGGRGTFFCPICQQ